jgi:hypothetical protein
MHGSRSKEKVGGEVLMARKKTNESGVRSASYYDRFIPGGKVRTRPVRYYDKFISGYQERGTARGRKLHTAVTFTAEELAALAEYIAAGLVLLRVSKPHAAVSKFKAALSRVKVPAPRGL